MSVAQSLTNHGTIELDYFYGQGGAHLSVGSTLDNENYLQVGNGGQTIADMLTVATLINKGTINLNGNSATMNDPVGATLAVGSAAGTGTAGHLTGTVYLSGDTLLQFGSGQIQAIDGDASLRINGSNAYVADAGSTSSNSALTGLNEVDGNLTLDNSAAVATSGGFTNFGSVNLDYYYGESGSALTVAGNLDNENTLQIGNGDVSIGSTVTVGSLTNGSAGSISLSGSSSVASQLVVGAAAGTSAAGELTGSIYLGGDTLLQFASGQIQTIDADGTLRLSGSNAYVADAGSTTSNSALTGLTENDGGLTLDNSAAVSTSASVVNYGSINLDYYNGETGSTLTVNGTFDNENYLLVGNGNNQLLGDVVTATSLTNNGSIYLNGNLSGGATHFGTLAISGAVVNNGSISVSNDKQAFAGAVTGTGSMTVVNGSTLEFDSSVAAAQSVSFNGTDQLLLTSANSFAAAINNFGTGDTLDLKGYASGTTISFAENNAGTAGTLTVGSGANSAHLLFNGSYTTASFATPVSDGAGGLIINHT